MQDRFDFSKTEHQDESWVPIKDEDFAKGMTERWQNLLRLVRSELDQNSFTWDIIYQYSNHIQKYSDHIFKKDHKGKFKSFIGYFKESDTESAKQLALNDVEYFVGGIAVNIKDALLEFDRHTANNEIKNFLKRSLNFVETVYINKYELFSNDKSEYKNALENFNLLCARAEIAIEEQIQAKESLDLLRQNNSETLALISRETEQEINLLKSSIKEKIITTKASSYWIEKRIKHRNIAIGFGLINIGIFAIAILNAICYSNEFRSFVVIDPAKGVDYGMLTLLLIPVIAIAWFGRVFMRIALNSLQNSEDARQREVLIQTYLALLSDKNTEFKEMERLLMLNAIFRPLPGHNNEEINPPTITEIISEAMRGDRSKP